MNVPIIKASAITSQSARAPAEGYGTLPPLPEPYFGEPRDEHDTHLGPCYAERQMLEYAQAAQANVQPKGMPADTVMWRDLEVGERIEAGDRFADAHGWTVMDADWVRVMSSHPEAAVHTPQSKPTQRRVVAQAPAPAPEPVDPLEQRKRDANKRADATTPKKWLEASERVAAKLRTQAPAVGADTGLVRFIGVDPTDPTRGAVLPMIPDSWRFGFASKGGGNEFAFGFRDDGEYVAYEAVRDALAAQAPALKRLTGDELSKLAMGAGLTEFLVLGRELGRESRLMKFAEDLQDALGITADSKPPVQHKEQP